MNVPLVDLSIQHKNLQVEIENEIKAVISESAFIRGQRVKEFESKFGSAHQDCFCIACANGTDALYIAMKGLEVKNGDEVITTAHSWISTSETITQAGGKAVFCEKPIDLDIHNSVRPIPSCDPSW